jgi:hypothetical protein
MPQPRVAYPIFAINYTGQPIVAICRVARAEVVNSELVAQVFPRDLADVAG